jgi:RNase adapter protein RapZ
MNGLVRDAAEGSEQAGRTRPADRHRLVLVTGLSGAGKTAALKALEDLGYEAFDNLPLALLGALLEGARRGSVAIGVDARTRDVHDTDYARVLDAVHARPGFDVDFLFLDCDDDVLVRRFTETRRRHPMAEDRTVSDGIRRERKLLEPMRARADQVIDTTLLTAADLKRLIGAHYALDRQAGMALSVISFSYRRGLPREADLVFDVRFLRNPHYLPTLKPLTGREGEVGAYIAADPAFAPFFEQLAALLKGLLPGYRREGKSYLTIAIGCTGGRHRSVYTAERLAETLRADGQDVAVRHRDCDLAAA